MHFITELHQILASHVKYFRVKCPPSSPKIDSFQSDDLQCGPLGLTPVNGIIVGFQSQAAPAMLSQ
jgi:hypothetical protein